MPTQADLMIYIFRVKTHAMPTQNVPCRRAKPRHAQNRRLSKIFIPDHRAAHASECHGLTCHHVVSLQEIAASSWHRSLSRLGETYNENCYKFKGQGFYTCVVMLAIASYTSGFRLACP